MSDYYLVAFMMAVGFNLVFHRDCSTMVTASDRDKDPLGFLEKKSKFLGITDENMIDEDVGSQILVWPRSHFMLGLDHSIMLAQAHKN